jgi:flagellar motility protein MotE (MotC chaperone)
LSKYFDKLLARERELEGLEACAKQVMNTAEELNNKTAQQLKEIQRVRAQILEYVDQGEKRQAEVYRKMDPRKAAKCIATLDVPTASKLLSILPPKTQALILAEMPRQLQAKIQRHWKACRDQLLSAC